MAAGLSAATIAAAALAGTAYLGKTGSDYRSSQFENFADDLKDINDLITYQKLATKAAAEAYNMTEQYAELESTQTALASGMGKSVDSASVQNIKKEDRKNLKRDLRDLGDDLSMVGGYLKINSKARRAATQAEQNTRTTQRRVGGILTAGRTIV